MNNNNRITLVCAEWLIMHAVIAGLMIMIVVLIVRLWAAALKARISQGNNSVSFQFANK